MQWLGRYELRERLGAGGDLAVAEAYAGEALELAVGSSPKTRGVALRRAGAVARHAGRLEDARTLCGDALELLGDEAGSMRLLAQFSSANIALVAGDAVQAVALYRRVVLEAVDLGDIRVEAMANGNLGYGLMAMGHTDEAMAVLERAQDLDRSLGRKAGVASVHGNLGVLGLESNDFEAAEDHFEQALALYAHLGDAGGQGRMLANLGFMNLERDELEKAAALLERAEAAATRARDVRSLGVVRGFMGLVHRERGERALAEGRLELALASARQVGDRRYEGHWLAELARIRCDERSIAALDQADALLSEAADPMMIAIARTARAEVLWRRGMPADAQSLLEAIDAPNAEASRAIARVRALMASARPSGR
ncbi:MAG: tetratricopeptide repeat protein [Proteobacteria bacterium]|nr:tetratricopeptide repeat protein [Pseudomonadota bacterium]